ncbi:MAG: T9SS type A sorting domain-containing protein [Bacteroidota bacterium]
MKSNLQLMCPIFLQYLFLILFFFGSALHLSGQNLIANPDCEEALSGGEIPSWTEVQGFNWTRRTSSNPGAQSGVGYFFAGVSSRAELMQEVDVSAQAALIDAGAAFFQFNGYVRSFSQSPPDTSRIILEYRDGPDGNILASFDSGKRINRTTWELVSDARFAPPLTRSIRIRLFSMRGVGSNNDGYTDNLSLILSGSLPVELTAFKASTIGNSAVKLEWTTASEQNNAGFNVQRSSDGHNWATIDFVKGHGNTEQTQQYEYLDKAPFSGDIYYRLQQLDYDNHYEFSPIRQVSIKLGKEKYLHIQPNPNWGDFTLQVAPPNSDAPHLWLYDSTGRIIWQKRFVSHELTASWEKHFHSLKQGIYFVALQTRKTVETKRFVVMAR